MMIGIGGCIYKKCVSFEQKCRNDRNVGTVSQKRISKSTKCLRGSELVQFSLYSAITTLLEVTNSRPRRATSCQQSTLQPLIRISTMDRRPETLRRHTRAEEPISCSKAGAVSYGTTAYPQRLDFLATGLTRCVVLCVTSQVMEGTSP